MSHCDLYMEVTPAAGALHSCPLLHLLQLRPLGQRDAVTAGGLGNAAARPHGQGEEMEKDDYPDELIQRGDVDDLRERRDIHSRKNSVLLPTFTK